MDSNSLKNLFISFIVPVYNTSSDYLRQCFDSVLKIDSCSFELLIVNDGSTNSDTLKILDEYSAKSNVRVINKGNGGVSSARNVALDNAVGEYIVFVDSDDYIETNNFADIVKIIKDNPGISVFAFTHSDVDNNGNRKMAGCNSGNLFIVDSIFNLYKMGIKYNASIIRESCCNKIYKKSIISGIRFKEGMKYGEDNLFVLEVCDNVDKILAVCRNLYNVRTNRNSATNKYNPNILEERLVNLYKLEELYIEKNYKSQMGIFCNDAIFRTYIHLILRLWIFHRDCPLDFKAKRNKAIEILHGEPFGRMFKNADPKELNIKAKITYYLLNKDLVFLGYKFYSMHKPQFIK